MVGFGTVVSQNMGAAAASSFALVLCCNGKSVVSVLTGWCAQRPSGRCAGSGPETAAFACSFSLVLWSGASLSHLGLERQRDKWLPFKPTRPKRTVYGLTQIMNYPVFQTTSNHIPSVQSMHFGSFIRKVTR